MVKMEVDRAKALGLPTKYIKSEEVYNEEKQMQQAQMQQAQMMQQAQQAASIGETVGKTPGGEQLMQDAMGQLGEQLGQL